MTMKNITFSQATLEAMDEEMSRDERVFVMGEDIARQGGIFGQFRGLPEKFGMDRVRDTPISETAIIGSAVGAALAGMRPVADMHFADFIGVAMDEVGALAADLDADRFPVPAGGREEGLCRNQPVRRARMELARHR